MVAHEKGRLERQTRKLGTPPWTEGKEFRADWTKGKNPLSDPFAGAGGFVFRGPMKKLMSQTPPVGSEMLLRLPAVLARIPVSRATWWRGVKSGCYPAGLRLSARSIAWKASDIDALIKSL